MLRLTFILLTSFFSLSCQQQQSELIDADALKNLQSDGVAIIDIRTPKEYKAGHIPGVPNIDFLAPDFLEQISEYKGKPIIIHCQSGGRSGKATTALIEAGFVKVYDYSGGFGDWKRRGEEIEK